MVVFGIIAYALLILASMIACLNFYLAFLRYPVYRWRGGAKADYRWTSGLCGVGTILCIFAVILLPCSPWPLSSAVWAWIVVLQVVDVGSVPWFIVTVTVMTLLSCVGLRRW